jgi:hypothetical protein
MRDEELQIEVGWRLKARCENFSAAVEAVRGRMPCQKCRMVIVLSARPEDI